MSKFIDEIKSRISCFDYACGQLGLRIAKPGGRCAATFRGGANPTSLMIDDRHFWDFGSNGGQGTGGDIIDLVMYAEGLSFWDAVNKLAALAGIDRPSEIDWGNSSRPDLTGLARRWHANLTTADRDYLHRRGIHDATIDKLLLGRGDSLGLTGRLIIPYWQGGRVVYFCGRATDDTPPDSEGNVSKYKKLQRDDITRHPIWGLDTFGRDGPLIIAEGAFDALSCWQEGFAVISPITGRFSGEQRKDLLSLVKGRRVIVCLDFDPVSKTGQQAQAELAEFLFGHGILASMVSLESFSDGGKVKSDLSELYAAGRNIRDILNESADFVSFRIGQLASESGSGSDDKLRDLLKAAARFCPPEDIAKWIARAKATKAWIIPWLNELKKTLVKAPPAHDLADRVLEVHDLVFNEKLGIYEYNPRGVWLSRELTAIKGYIDQALGGHSNGPLLASAAEVIKSRVHVEPEVFNRQRDHLNLRNGMLDLKTRELVPHRPGFFSTIQLDAEYQAQPQGSCQLYLRHLWENVCRCNEALYRYLLAWMADTVQHPFQRPGVAIVLRGKQGVGKTIAAIEHARLFGRHFVEVTQQRHLVGNFNAHLRDMLIVVADEAFVAESKLVESVLKGMISDDYLQIEAKGRDVVQVENHLRLWLTSNEGWVIPAGLEERRFCVLDVGEEHLQDSTYFGAIREEMENGGRNALFNYLLAYDLSQVNLRRIPQTQALLEQKLHSMSPVERFWHGRLYLGRLLGESAVWAESAATSDLFRTYIEECNVTGERRRGDEVKFGLELHRLCPRMERRRARVPVYTHEGHQRSDLRWIYFFPSLAECRRAFDIVTNTHWRWPKDDQQTPPAAGEE